VTGRDRISALAVALGVGAALLLAHTVIALDLGRGYAIPVTIIGAIATAAVLTGPVGQALGKRISGEAGGDLPPEQVLGELDELRTRIAELEERADFSERLLARQRDADRVAGPDGEADAGPRRPG
jgi:hypothetical protein